VTIRQFENLIFFNPLMFTLGKPLLVFEFKAVQIKWFGTHTGYGRINASTINYKKK
jgi:hypothetical protein